MPNTLAHFAVSPAISTNSSSVGLMLIAQSPIARTSFSPVADGRTRMNHYMVLAYMVPRTVSAVEYVAPPRRESATPILTNMVPK